MEQSKIDTLRNALKSYRVPDRVIYQFDDLAKEWITAQEKISTLSRALEELKATNTRLEEVIELMQNDGDDVELVGFSENLDTVDMLTLGEDDDGDDEETLVTPDEEE